MAPWAADGGYFNFAERPCDVDAILPGDVCGRLAEVKRQWDPDGMIVANHAVSLGCRVLSSFGFPQRAAPPSPRPPY